jgi:hypothetical protein
VSLNVDFRRPLHQRQKRSAPTPEFCSFAVAVPNGQRTVGRSPAASISLMAHEDSEPGREPGAAGAPIDQDALRCSFCGKTYAEVETMVCGPTPSVAICNECVELCTEIIAEESGGPRAA